MTDDKFWVLIAKSLRPGLKRNRQLEALAAALRALSPSEIEAFESAFQRQVHKAYRWDLWGAAYVICGGASDDGFEYFLRWLISKGFAVFDAALANPDSLADVLPPDVEGPADFEEFAYVARQVWEEKTGVDSLTDPDASFPAGGSPVSNQAKGAPFDEDHVDKDYPKLWKRFGKRPLWYEEPL